MRGFRCCQELPDLFVIVARPQQAALLAILSIGGARPVHQMVPDEQGGSQRAARIARGGLDPELFEGPLAQQPAVGHTVERHSPGQDEVFHLRLPPHLPGHAQHDFLGDLLDARGQVHVPLFEQGFRGARRPAEKPVEPFAGHRQPRAVVEILHVHPKAAVRLEPNQVPENRLLIDRLAVGGQPHQFVFAAVDLESAVIGEGRIEQSQRMGKL